MFSPRNAVLQKPPVKLVRAEYLDVPNSQLRRAGAAAQRATPGLRKGVPALSAELLVLVGMRVHPALTHLGPYLP